MTGNVYTPGLVVGIAGAARSGKGEVAETIRLKCEASGLSCHVGGFADLLKVSAARSLGFVGTGDEALAWGNSLKDPDVMIRVDREGGTVASVTGREYLQRYGQEAHREVFGPDFWIARALAPAAEVDVLVLADVRYENEAGAILAAGGEVWSVTRPGHEGIAESGHESEAGIPPRLVTRYLVNAGSLRELHLKARLALATYRVRASIAAMRKRGVAA